MVYRRLIKEGYAAATLEAKCLHKAVRARYFRPRMNKDSSEIVKHYDKCQRFDKITTNPTEELSPVSSP
jgi:hypothetical protein